MERADWEVVEKVVTQPPESQGQIISQSLQALPLDTQKNVLTQGLKALPDAARDEVGSGAGLERPTGVWNAMLWIMIVLSFCLVLVGGAFILYLMSRDAVDTTVVAPIVTTVLGALVGLLAPSPVQRRATGGSL